MASRCTVCAHPDRAQIDRELADAHTTNQRVADQYGLGRMAVSRHRDKHVSEVLKVLTRRVGVIEADLLNGELVTLLERCDETMRLAAESKSVRERVRAQRESRETLALLAKMTFAMIEHRPEVESVRPDIDAAISAALERKLAQANTYSPSAPPPPLALGPVEDAELVD